MAKIMTEHVSSYFYDKSAEYGIYNVFACYDSMDDYDNRKVSFYDVYDDSGLCVNEGEPFFDMPSWNLIYELYYLPSIREASKDHPRDLKWAIQ